MGAEVASGEGWDRLVADYAVPEGMADELFARPGVLRPVWRPFLERLGALSPEALARKFARGDQYLRDAGVFFRQYADVGVSERDWPLSHVPVILADDEWSGIAAGLIERADLLETIVADIYGAQRLVAGGHLPAELLASSPEWLRPMMGVVPASGHFLHHLAFEIGRNPDGSWFVLGDRTQAPSGAGFALENRMATSRVFSEFYARANIHRLAGFFRAFRDTLDAMPGGRPAILTPGPNTDTYFEHVFIARYLGLLLLEGEDLTVEDGRVMVRTVAGLSPVSVLWRRLDAAFADPLELDERSQIGSAGLVSALRAGGVGMVNALGSGVLETRALMAFIPRIAEVLLNRKLALPNIATWWCGHEAQRAHVKANTARMMVSPAPACDLPFELRGGTVIAGKFRDAGHGPVEDWIEAEAGRLVGQEAVSLSTTPVWHEGRLVARPMTVRVFLARTAGGWVVMPGGYARIGPSNDATALAMQRGGSVADVWIVAERPVPRETLAPAGGSFDRVRHGALPSRAADNLFWLGRYAERCEGTLRLLRAYHLRLAETDDRDDPRMGLLAEYLEARGVDVTPGLPPEIKAIIDRATACAGKVRDRFSVDGWAALHDLSKTLGRMAETVEPGDDAARAMGILLRKTAGFSGLVHDNMYRFTGWRFLEIGRALERADMIAAVLECFADDAAPEGCIDIAVEVGDSVLTHRRRYREVANRATAVDLLALDARNPRAILFQLEGIREQVAALPGAVDAGRLSPLARQVQRICTDLAVAAPEDLTTAALADLRAALGALSQGVFDAYLR